MPVDVVATYRPSWRDGAGRAVAGPDEDATTMAVSVAAAVMDATATRVDRVVVVSRRPALLEGPTTAVIATALNLDACTPVEIHIGGGPAVLDALIAAAPGTLVVGVDPDAPAAAGAALAGASGACLEVTARVESRLPARTRAPGQPARVCDDPRLLRDLGWRRAITAHDAQTGASLTDLAGAGPTVVVGPPPAAAAALGGDRPLAEAVAAHGAAAPLLAIAELATGGQEGVVAALEGDGLTAARFTAGELLTVIRDEPAPRPALVPPAGADTGATPIPGSAAAYARAFEAKVGMAGGRCPCGALDLPPRYQCLACGREGAWTLERLPRSGTVYTAVTIHAPVPGRTTPYSLAIVDLDQVGIRHLAPLTGVAAGAVAIGDHGRLVLRRLADREVGPDYGWAFLPDPVAVAEVAS